jgi:transcriptional regulator with XRE-family HTH domain
MSGSSLKETLERLGLRQTELAKLIDVSPRTVSLWATGDTSLPGPVAAYLRVLQLLTPEALRSELGRLKERASMFDEGIYSLEYRVAAADPSETLGTALAVLRNGKILGSDRWGGVFSGRYEFDTLEAVNKVHVRMQVPPDGELVTGFAAGPAGAILDIVGAFDRAAPVAETTVEVGGRPVDVRLRYLGPLPN